MDSTHDASLGDDMGELFDLSEEKLNLLEHGGIPPHILRLRHEGNYFEKPGP